MSCSYERLDDIITRNQKDFQLDIYILYKIFEMIIKIFGKYFFFKFQGGMIDCSKCHCVSYCSQEHLKEDLEDHKKSCSLLEISLKCHQNEIC